MNINQGSFQPVVDAINTLGIPSHALVGIFALVGTQPLTTEALYKAWTAYQSAGFTVVRAAS